MLVYLPVKIYNKCSNIAFEMDINNDIISIKNINESTIYNIILFSKKYGINTIPIFFPLNFKIIENELLSDNFYMFHILSTENDFDFINILINTINEKYNKNYKLFCYKNINNIMNILKLQNDNTNTDTDMDTDIDTNINNNSLSKLYNRVSKYINFCLCIIIGENISKVSQTSKILKIINLIKLINFTFYGNTMSINDHIEHIYNNKLHKKNCYYFYEANNKIIKIKYNDKIKNLNPYPTKYKSFININNLINYLIINKFSDLFYLTSNVINKKKHHLNIYLYSKLFDSFDNFIQYEIKENNTKNVYLLSFEKFKNNINNYDETIINNLLSSFIFPINFDRRTLNENFIKILYYCYKYHDQLNHLNINHKIKSIIFFIIKIFKSFENNDYDIICNSRIYTENILYSIIKIILLNNNDLLNSLNINIDVQLLKQKFINNIITIHILNNISWNTIPKQLSALKYIINIKDKCKDLIFVDGKINKHYSMDNRLKKVIVEPILMFNYLKKKDDFYKWLVTFKEITNKIFNNMINLDSNDYYKLSDILFTYSKIKNQKSDDINYKRLLILLKKDSKLILFNDRINIKFKDIFKNININLGYLARDIINEETISVSISEDIESVVSDSTETINKLKKKYYKYKGKYLEMKYTETAEMTEDN